jgi:heme exporter protein C
LITRFANPGKFLKLAARVQSVSFAAAALALGLGVYLALAASPPDYQQGEAVRIMYVHVPAAWMALFIYATMAVAAFVGLVWKHVVAELYPKAVAPAGAAFTFICLATGSLWGKPMWGAWWVWDARLTSVLILLFLYAGYMALVEAFDDEQRGIDAGAWLLLAGAVNIPVIKFSVDWWQTLHQPASVLRLDGPAIDPAMLWPLLVMAVFMKAFFIWIACLRLRAEIALRRARLRAAAEEAEA